MDKWFTFLELLFLRLAWQTKKRHKTPFFSVLCLFLMRSRMTAFLYINSYFLYFSILHVCFLVFIS